MKCPKCQFENPEGAKFCRDCGTSLELDLTCPNCGSSHPPGSKFCIECGHDLTIPSEPPPKDDSEPKPHAPEPVADESITTPGVIEGERKHVTALFSDLSGYTAMSEKLDPEEVKEITSRIFGEISQIVSKYDGFIEKFIGDAVMALFGVPKAHEDDPVRAIRAAMEIHDSVRTISPELEEKIGKPLSMHTGVNTGLVVTGEVNLEKGTHGVAGDTINVAARLSSLADAGTIIVGPDTYRHAEGYFTFEGLKPTKVKGKAEPVQFFKVLSAKERPVTIHRLSGLRADLIGRKSEIAQLDEAVENLQEGKSRIFSICGDAGTGKSRLVEEFKARLDLKAIQWLEGHAYAYSRNIPYFPLRDLLNRAFQIEEGDPPKKVRQSIELGIEHLIGKREDVVPYVGSLYTLSYPEVEDVSPQFWKSRLLDAAHTILSALAERAPTIFCLEDLHWADPSFVELLRYALLQIRQPAIFLCVYRPTFSLFTSHQLGGIGKIYHEIRLQDLSTSEAQDMLESLLKTEAIPSDLERFVRDKAEGNPFYLEELVNSLIESETLVRDNGRWKIARPIVDSELSSTIHGIISGRLDRLEKETKRILQEASVIGRAFLYEILKRITEVRKSIDRRLGSLEQLDIIRIRSLQPDLEYVFKHALTQEAVYKGLLRKERREIHERIGHVIEQLFHGRLSEFYEKLAFHFKQGHSIFKAVDYLMKSGEKSLKRYAVEEAHQYYKEAFELLADRPQRTREEDELLIDILTKWAYAFYYRGDLRDLTELLITHEDLAESLTDKARLGMFYAWFGYAMWGRERLRDSYRYLNKALKLGEEIRNKRVIGYSCAWLSMTCAEMGLLEEAVLFGERGKKIGAFLESDHSVYFLSLSGMGQAYWHKGERKNAFEVGKALLEHGKKSSNTRSMVTGYYTIGHSYFAAGDFQSAAESYKKAVQISVDPYYSQFPKTMLCYSYISNGQFQEAKGAIHEILNFNENFGVEIIGTPARALLGLILIAEGSLSRGMQMVEDVRKTFLEKERRCLYALSEYTLGKIYLNILERMEPISFTTIVKNIGFLIKLVPSVARKAKYHFEKSIEVSKEIEAKGMLGMAYLDLGRLYRANGKKEQARKCISDSIQLFEQCEAEKLLKQAKDVLESLDR